MRRRAVDPCAVRIRRRLRRGACGRPRDAGRRSGFRFDAADRDCDVGVQASISGFSIDTLSADGEPQGKVIFYVDVDVVPTKAGAPARTEPGTYQAVSSERATWPDVAPGRHALFVQLVNADETPLNPAVTARTVITVSG